MKNKYLHWVVICVIIGATFFCAQKLSQYNKNTNTLEEQILASGEIYETQNTNTVPANLSGTTSTGSVKPVFRPPNTEWKTRTITLEDGRTLTYEFGKGNPREVALSKEEIREVGNQNCDYSDKQFQDTLYKLGFCNPESASLKYVSQDTEKYLFLALSDPNWDTLSQQCEKALRFINDSTNSDWYTFDLVFSLHFLDIENFITVDQKTGWKKLDSNKLFYLMNFLENGRNEIGRGEVIINPYGDCVNVYGTEILKNLRLAYHSYFSPTEY